MTNEQIAAALPTATPEMLAFFTGIMQFQTECLIRSHREHNATDKPPRDFGHLLVARQTLATLRADIDAGLDPLAWSRRVVEFAKTIQERDSDG